MSPFHMKQRLPLCLVDRGGRRYTFSCCRGRKANVDVIDLAVVVKRKKMRFSFPVRDGEYTVMFSRVLTEYYLRLFLFDTIYDGL